jgi:hypothetical protein
MKRLAVFFMSCFSDPEPPPPHGQLWLASLSSLLLFLPSVSCLELACPTCRERGEKDPKKTTGEQLRDSSYVFPLRLFLSFRAMSLNVLKLENQINYVFRLEEVTNLFPRSMILISGFGKNGHFLRYEDVYVLC